MKRQLNQLCSIVTPVVFLLIFCEFSLVRPLAAGARQPNILVAYDQFSPNSRHDKNGVVAALNRAGIMVELIRTDQVDLTTSEMCRHAGVVLCEFILDASEVADVRAYVQSGGGIFVTGKAANGIENLLGLKNYSIKTHDGGSEIRFTADHPVSFGAYWNGPSMQHPPMPQDEIPGISQYRYPGAQWPGYKVTVSSGTVIAHWYPYSESWKSSRREAAIVVNTFAAGKTVYSGALPGIYADPAWNWPLNWQHFIVNAVEWTSHDNYLTEIGFWPKGNRSAFVFSSDTETPDMATAVPLILDLFSELGLKNYGTFYVVGQAGGDEGTQGAVEHPQVVQMIAARGSEVAGHGDVHTGFLQGTLVDQQTRLQAMVDILNPLLAPYGEVCRGFRAPHVDFTRETFEAAKRVGLLYESSDIDVWSETTFPTFNKIWEATPTMPMDWFLFEHFKLSDSIALEIFTDKFEYTYAKRSMFNMLTHPWVIDGHLEVLRDLLQAAMGKNDVWMVRQDRLIEWWRQRFKLLLVNSVRAGTRLRMHIANSGDQTVINAAALLRLPEGSAAENVQVRLAGQTLEIRNRRHNEMDFIVAIIPMISAGDTVMIEFSGLTPTSVKSFKSGALKPFKIYQNFPNPFNPETEIPFDLENEEYVRLTVFDVQGRQVTNLLDEHIKAGRHSVVWNAGDEHPKPASGLYLARMQAGGQTKSIKLLLLK